MYSRSNEDCRVRSDWSTPIYSIPCFLLLIMVTAMNASQGIMTQTVYMDGRDKRPAMTNLL